MKEQIEKMYIQALIDDLPPNVFADQVLLLFDVVGQSEQLSCDTCFFKNRTYIKCGDCKNYDKYEKAT